MTTRLNGGSTDDRIVADVALRAIHNAIPPSAVVRSSALRRSDFARTAPVGELRHRASLKSVISIN